MQKGGILIAPKPFEDPIRAELFGIERLEQHAASLAVAQRVKSGRGRQLLSRVENNGRVLRESYRVIANAIREERSITPAAEWLVDNFSRRGRTAARDPRRPAARVLSGAAEAG